MIKLHSRVEQCNWISALTLLDVNTLYKHTLTAHQVQLRILCEIHVGASEVRTSIRRVWHGYLLQYHLFESTPPPCGTLVQAMHSGGLDGTHWQIEVAILARGVEEKGHHDWAFLLLLLMRRVNIIGQCCLCL